MLTQRVEYRSLEHQKSLASHRYPIWICLMGLGVTAVLVLSLIQLPSLYRAALLLHRGEMLAEHGPDNSAIESLTNALITAPASKRVRIALDTSYFKSPDVRNQKKASPVHIPMSISHSDLMPISSERSDAGLSQSETVIDISQEFFLPSFRAVAIAAPVPCFWALTEGVRKGD